MMRSIGCANFLALAIGIIVTAATVSDAASEVLKVGIIKLDGFCTPKSSDESDGKPDNWEGFIPDVVNELGKKIHFTPQYQLVPDKKYGAFDELTQAWNGLIGEVGSHKVDFGAATVTITSRRDEHIDFSHEILDIGLVVLIKRPDLLRPVLRGTSFFFGVFSSGVWGIVFAAFAVTSFLLHLNDRYNPRENRAKMVEHISAAAMTSGSPLNQFTLLGSAFYVLSTGCFQGYQRAPRSLCGRCLSLCWWVFACLLAATYTSGFLCSLVASGSRQDNTFSYLDARDQYDTDKLLMQAMVPLWIPGGSTAALMQNSSDGLFQQFNKLHQDAARDDKRVADIKSIEDLIDLLKKGSHFFGIVESPIADYYARQSNCELVVTGQFLRDRSWAFVFPENSTYLGKMNEAILELRESGFIRHTYHRHIGGPFVSCAHANPTIASSALGLAGEELARMFRDSLPITLNTFAGPVALYFISVMVSAMAALIDLQIFANIERHHNPPQVLRSTQEPADDPNFSEVGVSSERRSPEQLEET